MSGTRGPHDARIRREMPGVVELAGRFAADWPEARRRFEDLVATGNLALVEAAERFDPVKGDDFGAFAYKRVRGAMIRFCADRAYRNDSIAAIFKASLREEERDDLSATTLFEAAMASEKPNPRADVIGDMRRMLGGMAAGLALDPPESGGEEEVIERIELRRAVELLRMFISELPSRKQEILRLIYCEGLTHLEAAARLRPRVDKKTVQRDHDSAREILDQRLRDAGVDPASR